MDRSASEPPNGKLVGVDVNPFYSEKMRREMALQACRPMGLPEPSPGSGVVPLRDQIGADRTGKGRGGGQTAGKVSCFVTPPSKTGNLDGRDEMCPRKT